MRHLDKPDPPVTFETVVYDMPSGTGGTFTVQIVDQRRDHVKVQTIYGALSRLDGAFIPFDDVLEFWTELSLLTNKRLFRQPESDWRRGR